MEIDVFEGSWSVSAKFSQFTRLTDGRTDGQKGLRYTVRTVRCITCSCTVKNVANNMLLNAYA